MVSQGEELAAVTRFTGDLPETVRIMGRLDGKEFVRDVPVKEVQEKAGYLPRSWAKLEIDRLLAEDAPKHKEGIVELTKAMYVMTPFTSLLVLENDDMYKHFKVDRGRKDHWAMYPAPEKIKVVFEPIEGDAGDPKKGIKPSAKLVSGTVLERPTPFVLRSREERSMLGSLKPMASGGIAGVSFTLSPIPLPFGSGGGMGGTRIVERRPFSPNDEEITNRREDWTLAALNDPEKKGASPGREFDNDIADNRPRRPALDERFKREPHLTNADLGMDDSLPLAYNVNRIDEVSPLGGLPGQVVAGKMLHAARPLVLTLGRTDGGLAAHSHRPRLVSGRQIPCEVRWSTPARPTVATTACSTTCSAAPPA